MHSTKRALIVGAGISGATMAERLANLGFQVTVIEKRDHIAGNCYDSRDEHGILMNKYGAHIFHTNNLRVEEYVKRFSTWIPWMHRVVGRIGNAHFPIPVNIDTVNILMNEALQNEEDMKAWLLAHTEHIDPVRNSEDVALNRVGAELYTKIFREYTWKQWAKFPRDLDKSVLERIPVRSDFNPHYFSDRFQALPAEGYTAFVAAMLQHPNIEVRLGVDYVPSMNDAYSHIFYTGPIDQYFASYGLSKLEYRSIRFEIERLDVDQFQPNSVVNYPSSAEPWTRIVEYKHFLHQNCPGKTTIVREYTTSEGDPYYPVPTQQNQDLYARYAELARKEDPKVHFLGRLATYKYYNMDQAILAALEMFDALFLDGEKN